MKAASSESVISTDPVAQLYEILPVAGSHLCNMHVGDLSRERTADMQIVPFNDQPIAAVPISAVAPGSKLRNEKKKFDLPPGWTEQVTVRTAGKFKGRKDKLYFGPYGTRFRSRAAVKRALGIV